MIAVLIQAGEFKGLRIQTGNVRHLRPTTSRIRESIFNMVPNVSGAKVLDLYAGCGTLGFEALSRGASSVTFVDHDRRAVEVIELTGKLFRGHEVEVTPMDSFEYLSRSDENFDLIFADPPYGEVNLPVLKKSAWTHLIDGGFLIIESAFRDGWRDRHATIKRYGDTQVSLFKKERNP